MKESIDDVVTIFAYGSNMLLVKMRTRAPSATSLGAARLDQFALRWNKRSKDGSGKCAIEETSNPKDSVWGIVYELTLADRERLDRFEGVGHGYERRDVTVLLEGNQRRVSTYLATDIDHSLRPYVWYKEQVVVGAARHGLPPDYVRTLEGASSAPDPDTQRAERERRFVRLER
jgi:hypothetical protein